MDLKQYYKKIGLAEEQISEEYPLISSLETSDGGKAGRISEVSRQIAAKLMVEGRATLANEDEISDYRSRQAAAKRAAAKAEIARRVQIVIAEPEPEESTAGKKGSHPQGGK